MSIAPIPEPSESDPEQNRPKEANSSETVVNFDKQKKELCVSFLLDFLSDQPQTKSH